MNADRNFRQKPDRRDRYCAHSMLSDDGVSVMCCDCGKIVSPTEERAALTAASETGVGK
jgi:hypothetical protein